jgi:hypothetical protein
MSPQLWLVRRHLYTLDENQVQYTRFSGSYCETTYRTRSIQENFNAERKVIAPEILKGSNSLRATDDKGINILFWQVYK